MNKVRMPRLQSSIKEESYSDLTNNEEGNLYQIVLASTHQLARIRSYLRRHVEKVDPLDMEACLGCNMIE